MKNLGKYKTEVIKHNVYKQFINEKLKEKNSKQMICTCGSIHILQNKSRHLRSKKHQTYLKTLEQN